MRGDALALCKVRCEFRGGRTIFVLDFTSKPHQCPHKEPLPKSSARSLTSASLKG